MAEKKEKTEKQKFQLDRKWRMKGWWKSVSTALQGMLEDPENITVDELNSILAMQTFVDKMNNRFDTNTTILERLRFPELAPETEAEPKKPEVR